MIEIDSGTDGSSVAARVVTDEDRAQYAVEYAAFKSPELPPPSYEELVAEWREKHPKQTVGQMITRRDALRAKADKTVYEQSELDRLEAMGLVAPEPPVATVSGAAAGASPTVGGGSKRD